MPGGSKEAWPHVKDIFQGIAAKVEDGTPCCDWVGENGAGHYVKMVHNGIEYGDMQLICEAYQLMKDGLGMTAAEMQQVLPIGTRPNWIPTSSKSPPISWPSRTPTASRWWTKFLTPPARKAPANGRSSIPANWASPSP
jgi:3-hydroxyisobutyrate dehydrogenase-like beta-hydroxyacid dehydrogenase